MKRIAKRSAIFTLIIFSCTLSSSAQNFTPFAELTMDEVQLKQCSFDPEANAVVLLHEAHSDYDESYHLVTKHHVRIKILKEKGLSNADVSIPFWRKDGFEEVVVTNAATISIDGMGKIEQVKVGQRSIFTKKINERIGEVVFSFPSVKVGDVLEYEFQSIMKHYGGLEDWYFQEERPVMVSKYTLVIVPNTEFTYSVIKRPDFAVVVTPNAATNSVYFEMKNIPGLGNEPYMDSRKDYLQKVFFQLSAYGRGDGFSSKYMTSWDEVNREMLKNSDFGGMIGKSIPGTDEFINSIKTKGTELEKMNAVYNYVRSNINWNGGSTKYAGDGLKNAWQKKSGTSAEINFILLNLLRAAGLQADPVMVSERWHGKVDTNYPFVDQFNSTVAGVTINGTVYYLDARNKFTPAHIIPNNILNTKGFWVNKKTGGLVNIVNDSLRYGESIFNTLTVNADGSVDGKVQVISEGYARVEKLEDYMDNKSSFVEHNFKKISLAAEIKNFEVFNTENDSFPFKQQCDFTSKLSGTGDYIMVPLNLFSGFIKNPFTGSNRFSNVNFGYKRSVYIATNISLPAGFVVDALPRGVRLMSEEKDILMNRLVEYNKEGNTVNVGIRIDFSKSLYDAFEYPMLQAFYIKMFEYLDEPLLLKKK